MTSYLSLSIVPFQISYALITYRTYSRYEVIFVNFLFSIFFSILVYIHFLPPFFSSNSIQNQNANYVWMFFFFFSFSFFHIFFFFIFSFSSRFNEISSFYFKKIIYLFFLIYVFLFIYQIEQFFSLFLSNFNFSPLIPLHTTTVAIANLWIDTKSDCLSFLMSTSIDFFCPVAMEIVRAQF